jgi:hypothetical protein
MRPKPILPLLASIAALTLAGCQQSLAESAAKVEAARHPAVDHVGYDEDWFDGDSLFVTLIPGATAADAKSVWCDVVIPAEVPGGVTIFVGPDLPVLANADMPGDCSDPDDVPPLVPWG